MLIGFNGFGYSIQKYLGPGKEEWRWNWNRRKVIQWEKSLEEETIVVGFSDGATAASHLPGISPFVNRVILHSPLFDRPIVDPNAEYWIYCTEGDRTSSAQGSLQLYAWLLSRGAFTVYIPLKWKPFDKPTLMERLALTPLRHGFHNLDLRTHPVTKEYFTN